MPPDIYMVYLLLIYCLAIGSSQVSKANREVCSQEYIIILMMKDGWKLCVLYSLNCNLIASSYIFSLNKIAKRML